MTFQFSARSKTNRKDVDARLIEIDDLAIQLSLIDFGHGNDAGKRKAKRQNELFTEGKSKADGYDRLSFHQEGKALDYFAWVDGEISYQPHHMTIIAVAYFQAANILGHKIEWGGLWKSRQPKYVNGVPYGWDMPHIQLG